VYCCNICKNGIWQEVVIDDFIPCYNNQPAFSRSNGDELWVILLEKAWAKLHKSYERIEAGFAENVMRDLTGAPTEVIETDEDELWDKLNEAEAKQFIVAASAGSTPASKGNLEDLGLQGNHSYGILRSIEVIDKMEDKVRLVQLRNPWGDFEWSGDWGDSDTFNWTPELKKQCGWTN